MKARKFFVLAAVGLALALGGMIYILAGPPGERPETVVEKYFQAIRGADFQAAYRHVSRREYHETFQQFTDRVSRYPAEMEIRVTSVDVSGRRATVYANYRAPSAFGSYNATGTMELVIEGRKWKIVTP